ncbi:MAG TPA: serine O-acetyltransferase [Phycisphaerales bacterium]|nr:serine O-acetyltransferase [Phycisphaerales bacterium]
MNKPSQWRDSSSSSPSGPPGGGGVPKDLVARLTESILSEPRTRHLGATRLPSRDAVGELVEVLRELTFPGYFGRRGLTPDNLPLHVEELLSRAMLHLEEQIASVLRYIHEIEPAGNDRRAPLPKTTSPEEDDKLARELTRKFVQDLPELRRLLALDVQAAFDGDPAAMHTDETIFCYPGVDAVFAHRVANALYRLGVPLLPRLIQEMAHSRTGIDIHPGATIGESFFVDHGGGVTIGQTTVIGDHVKIYQGVTLGAKSFDRDPTGKLIRDGRQRHPTIGNRATIYANAVILGGDTVIGEDCVIAGNVFLTHSVKPGHIVQEKETELVLKPRNLNLNDTTATR